MSNPGAFRLFDYSPEEVREYINSACMKSPTEIFEVSSVQDIKIKQKLREHIPLRVYSPFGEGPFPIILFIHGGAWVAGNLDTHDNLARYFCKNVGAVVVSVGYLNAPEGKYPYILEQCYDALLWTKANLHFLKGINDVLAVVGDSSGGNMAAALCLMTRDRKGPKIGYQVLLNPITDLTCGGTIEPIGDDLDNLRWQVSMYVRDSKDLFYPYVSPALNNNFSNIPPAQIILAKQDPLYLDGLSYAEKLKKNKISVDVYCQENVGHLAENGARATKKALDSLRAASSSLNNFFKKNG